MLFVVSARSAELGGRKYNTAPILRNEQHTLFAHRDSHKDLNESAWRQAGSQAAKVDVEEMREEIYLE